MDAAYEDTVSDEPSRFKQSGFEQISKTVSPRSQPTQHINQFHDFLPQGYDPDRMRDNNEVNSDEEEERVLEDLTKYYVFDDFVDPRLDKSKSALPK